MVAILAEMERLRRLRRLKGWTQERLAAEAGVHISTIHDLETGAGREPRPDTMRLIAEALGVPISEVREFVDSGNDSGTDPAQ
ncbi:MAG TPA: helix-turn-helix transcriptional regulator [Chloroflexota bacterium]|nr:helix-turn-helix transcriptional regulator [Chloroflexota bacterium]